MISAPAHVVHEAIERPSVLGRAVQEAPSCCRAHVGAVDRDAEKEQTHPWPQTSCEMITAVLRETCMRHRDHAKQEWAARSHARSAPARTAGEDASPTATAARWWFPAGASGEPGGAGRDWRGAL